MPLKIAGLLAVLVLSLVAISPSTEASCPGGENVLCLDDIFSGGSGSGGGVEASCFGIPSLLCPDGTFGGGSGFFLNFLSSLFSFLNPTPPVQSGGDIDVSFADTIGGVEPDHRAQGGTYAVNNIYKIFNDGILPVTTVTASGQVSINNSGNITTPSVVPQGGTNPVSCVTSNFTSSSFNWSCTFSLAADDGTPDDNTADGPGIDQIDILVTVGGTSPPTDGGDVITFGAVTVTAANATNGAVSPNNTDGGPLVIPQDTDELLFSYDLDLLPFTDGPAGEDLTAGGFTSLAEYVVFNDRASTSPLGPATLSGSVTASAFIFNAPVLQIAGGVGTFTCSTTNFTASSFDWICTFSLGPDTIPGEGSNTPSCTPPCDNAVKVTVGAIGTLGTAGDVITFGAATAAVDGAVDLTVSPKNADGGTLVYAADTDTLQ